MRIQPTIGLACGLALASVCVYGAGEVRQVRNLPYRIDPLLEPVPNSTTLVLCRFEDGQATDTSANHDHAVVRGRVTPTEDGRFGNGLVFAGGDGGVLLRGLSGMDFEALRTDEGYPLAIDFWCRLSRLPAGDACLCELATDTPVPAARVDLGADGRLRLSGAGLVPATSAEPVPVGEWFHVVVERKTVYQANYVYVDKAGAEVLLNGFTAVAAYTDQPRYRFPPVNLVAILSVGNSLRFDAGVAASIDELRVSRADRGFYRIYRQAFVDPGTHAPPGRASEHFQDPTREVFAMSFDAGDLDKVAPPADPQPIATVPAYLPNVKGTDLDLLAEVDVGEEFLAELDEEEEKGSFVPVRLVPGVRGQALLVHGGEARLELPPGLDLSEGTIEFWLKPVDWDNLTVPPHKDATYTYRNARPHILTLWGTPREGEGEAVPLVSLKLSRLKGAPPVAEEIQKYFGRPKDPIVPHKWTHVVMMWGDGLRHYQPYCQLDGTSIFYDDRVKSAKKADAETWQTHRPAFLTVGNGYATIVDELRVYSYPFEGAEPANARASYTGEPQEPLGGALVACEYRMSDGDLVATVRALRSARERVHRAQLALSRPDGGAGVSAAIPAFTNGMGTAVLDVGLLPEGTFPIAGTFFDEGGKAVGTFESSFVRRAIPWMDNRIGIVDTPPAPFTPVSVSGRRVTAVGREYEVGDDGNFSGIVVKGEAILAGPMHFEVVTGGQAVTLGASSATRVESGDQAQASWSAASHGGGVSIESRTSFEYDGMAKYTLRVAPEAGPVRVERLALKIPLKADYGWLLHALPVGGNFRGYHFSGTGALPEREGVIWDSQTWCAEKKSGAEKMALGNFVPMVWLGGAVRGLCWFADNDRGWVPTEEHPAITITRSEGTITLSLNFITTPFDLSEEREIVYGMLATPPKPPPENHRAWARGNLDRYGPVAGRITSCEAFAPWELPVKEGCMDYWPIGNDWEYAKLASDQQRHSSHGKYPPGQALMLYHDKRFVPFGPDTEYFRWEWHRNGQAAWCQSKIDCLVWHMDKWFGLNVMDGIYIDDVFPVADFNWQTGSAYRLPDGRVQPGSAYFAYRRYLKRMYNVFVSHGKVPIITLHDTHTVNPFHSFATAVYDGEDGYGFSPTATFIDAWPLDRLMALDNTERTGTATCFILKGEYVERGRNPEHWAHMLYRTYRSAWAMYLLFDMNKALAWDFNGTRFHSTLRYFEGPEADVYPFWRNADVVRVEAKLDAPITDDALLPKKWIWRRADFRAAIGREPLRATVFKRDNRCLLVLVNFVKCPVDAAVTFDFDGLGVPPDRRAYIKVTDVDDWGEPEGVDLQRLEKPDVADTALPDSLEDAGAYEEVDLSLLDDEDAGEALELDGSTLNLVATPHDFRAIELRW